jgi:hypothetical protein
LGAWGQGLRAECLWLLAGGFIGDIWTFSGNEERLQGPEIWGRQIIDFLSRFFWQIGLKVAEKG